MDNSISQDTKVKAPQPNVFSLLKPYFKMVFFLILMALLGNGVNLFIPKIIASNIDSFSSRHFDLKTLIIEFLGAAMAIFVFNNLQSIIQVFASERVARDLRSKLSNKISRQSYAFILKSNPSKLLTNLTSDIDSIKMFVSQAVVTIISSIFVIIGACIFTSSDQLEIGHDRYCYCSGNWRCLLLNPDQGKATVQKVTRNY